jgi:hypothetical protein
MLARAVNAKRSRHSDRSRHSSAAIGMTAKGAIEFTFNFSASII